MEASIARDTVTFPEAWDAPVDDGPVFTFDPMHTPYAVSPLQQSFARNVFDVSFANGLKALGVAGARHDTRYRNYFQYDRVVVPPPNSEEAAQEMGATVEATLTREVGRLKERWETEHLPHIKALLARQAALQPEQATDAELLAMLDEVFALQRELWTIHFQLAFPMLTSLQLFDEFQAELFDGADGSELTAGMESESVKAGLALGNLAASARALGLASLVRDTPAGDLERALATSDDGRAFLDQVADYLATYGFFQDLYEFQTPTWREDPSRLLAIVRSYLISGFDPAANFAAQVAAAESAVAEVRATLVAYPEAVRGQFEALLAIGQFGAFIHEEHNYYIDQQGAGGLRLFLAALGRRLAADERLAYPDDIFMLTLDEVQALIATPETAETLPALIARRRDEMHQARTMTPPPFIGPRIPGPPPIADSPLLRAMGRFFTPPPQRAEAPNQLKGAPASKGGVTGRARVARSLDEATSLMPGEVLVAITTMPAWTPLFGIASAVVTETGGPLSHCAIVAREYGIPAVVGAHGATHVIQTGQMVTVDGGRGVVTIEE